VSEALAVQQDLPQTARWRDAFRLVVDIGRARPWPLIAMVAFVLFGSVRTGIYLAAEGAFVDAFFTSDGEKALLWALIWMTATGSEELYWGIKPWLFSIVKDFAIHRVQKQVMLRATNVPLVSFEQGTFYARLQRASDDIGGKLTSLLISLIDTLQLFTQGASIVVALWFVSPWLAPILILGSIPAVLLEVRVASVVQQAMQRHALGSQLLSRIEHVIRDRNAGAKLRLFGNGHALVNHWRTTRNRRAGDVLDAEWRRARIGFGSEAIRTLAITICIAIGLWTITDQSLSIGSWAILTTGIQWLSGVTRGFTWTLRNTREQVAYAGDLFAYEDLADELIAAEQRTRAATTDHEYPPASATRRGMAIEVRNVSFAYPGNPEPVVRDLTVSIAPGETVAIVGENGAGKSTLIRLLTGLYLPDSGTIALDGIDTRSESAPALYARIGAVFQDYLSFQLPLRDNIAFGDASRDTDLERLNLAVRSAGIEHLLASLDTGYDTWLGRQFGDTDLSGGQWQRVALARAFYRDADLLILDEPTAALDPKAEQALFERFAALVADRTAIMISHRLASARFADRILVMDHGRLVEDGTHDTLMNRPGPYAAMFTAQAEWYR
jgi:ABC-type multidrug transport system fused ATPase/permease subunit